jgi:HD-GYP domain-containing protein (c-di-GMP phosphodiesterase class II)
MSTGRAAEGLTMTRKLRRRIWGRLLGVSILLATLAGASVYVFERREMGERVLALALEEARSLVPDVAVLSGAALEREEVRRELAAHVLSDHVAQGHFVLIEIYDLARTKVVAAQHPSYAEVARAADGELHASLLGDEPRHQRLTAPGGTYVQVFAPLRQGERAVAYFEGIYRVDPEALQTMDRSLLWSVGLVVVVILAAAAVLYPVILRLNRDLLHLSGDLAHANMGMLAALGSAIAKRDHGTNSHNYRVTIYAIRLAETVELSHPQIRGLIKGAFLHDVGKIGIADAILLKPGRLTEEETAVMRAHVQHGVEIVGKFRWLMDALEVVQHHHEKFDGTGYPAGLRADQIPIAARIFAIVDVFDALTTRRPYKEPASLAESMALLEAGRGTSFDPTLLDAFAGLAPELHRTISGAGEQELTRTLDRLLVRYFRGKGVGTILRAGPGGGPPAPGAESELDYLSGAWSLERPRAARRERRPAIAGAR